MRESLEKILKERKIVKEWLRKRAKQEETEKGRQIDRHTTRKTTRQRKEG